jgi:hypothetical protein
MKLSHAYALVTYMMALMMAAVLGSVVPLLSMLSWAQSSLFSAHPLVRLARSSTRK